MKRCRDSGCRFLASRSRAVGDSRAATSSIATGCADCAGRRAKRQASDIGMEESDDMKIEGKLEKPFRQSAAAVVGAARVGWYPSRISKL